MSWEGWYQQCDSVPHYSNPHTNTVIVFFNTNVIVSNGVPHHCLIDHPLFSFCKNMKLRLTRILRAAFRNQPNEPVDTSQPTTDRSTHAGHLSVNVFVFMLMKKDLFDFFSDSMMNYTAVEAGAGPGYFSMVASILGGDSRSVLAIERDLSRFRRLCSWKDILRNEEGIDEKLLPDIIHGDFTRDIDEFDHVIAKDRLAVYLNNYNNSLGDAQTKLEQKLSACLPGSVVIALDPMFTSDVNWREELFSTTVPRDHVSWMRKSHGTATLNFYKYTKLEVGEGGRRPRHVSGFLKIPYCFMNTNYL